jgi:hypothetical protein
MKESLIDSEYCEMWLENGIIFQIYKPDLVITIDIAKAMVEDRLKISNGITRPMLADIRNLVSIDAESREYLAGDRAIYLLSAGAILLGSSLKDYIATLTANIYLKIDRPRFPTKLFNDKEKALKWLETFRNLN